MFQTLPVVFSNMVGSHVLAISFFLLVALAALTSEISVLEPIIAYLVDKHDWTRKNAADWHLGGKNILELFDLVATTILVSLGGLLGVVLVTWRWGFAPDFKELTNGKMEKYPLSYLYLKICLIYLAPALILIIFFSNLSLFQQ